MGGSAPGAPWVRCPRDPKERPIWNRCGFGTIVSPRPQCRREHFKGLSGVQRGLGWTRRDTPAIPPRPATHPCIPATPRPAIHSPATGSANGRPSSSTGGTILIPAAPSSSDRLAAAIHTRLKTMVQPSAPPERPVQATQPPGRSLGPFRRAIPPGPPGTAPALPPGFDP
jgi:hypothetical protein